MKLPILGALSIAAFALLAVPANAAVLSDVDHPNVPNCTIFGPNAPNCELLTMIALFPPNGVWTSEACETVPYTNGKGEAKTKQVCHKQF